MASVASGALGSEGVVGQHHHYRIRLLFHLFSLLKRFWLFDLFLSSLLLELFFLVLLLSFSLEPFT